MPQQGRGGTAAVNASPSAQATGAQAQQTQQQQGVFKPLGVLAMPGLYLVYKYNQFKRQQQENNRRKLAERELNNLNNKILLELTRSGSNGAQRGQQPITSQKTSTSNNLF